MMDPILKPIPFSGGKHYWLWLIHPLQAEQLQNDSDWISAQQNANVRDLFLNPMFSKMDFGVKHKAMERPMIGALGIINDIVLVTYQKAEDRIAGEVFEAAGDAVHTNIADNTYRIARSLILGQEAGVISWGKRWMPHKKDFDYGRFPGMAMDAMYGCRKVNFRDPGVSQSTNTAQQDMGVVVVDTAVVD